MNGFVNIIKPHGMTSALCVMLCRKKLTKQFGKTKLGHMGTLDPMASGVLPMGINQSSRLFDYLLDKTKVYVATFKFGYETDTLDETGTVIDSGYRTPTEEEIENVLPGFIGEIDQIPPKYSAKCVMGKRGYELARRGVDFTLEPKKVTIIDLKLIEKTRDDEFVFYIKCKGGTYVRSIGRDIAYALETKATMTALDRVEAGIFKESSAVTLNDFMEADDVTEFIIPSDDVLSFDKLVLEKDVAQRILDGYFIDEILYPDGMYRVYSENTFWGVGIVNEKKLKIVTYVRDI